MRPIQWIFDTAPTEEAKLRALVVVNQILYIMNLTKSIVMQKIWTDGTYFFHFQASPATNSIRVWGESVGDIRFWVHQLGITWGLYLSGSSWKKIELIQNDITESLNDLVPRSFNYQWINTDQSISLYRLRAVAAATSVFWRTYPGHTGHYGRIGGSFYIIRDDGFGGTAGYDDTIKALFSDAYDSINRENGVIELAVAYNQNPFPDTTEDPSNYLRNGLPNSVINGESANIDSLGLVVHGGFIKAHIGFGSTPIFFSGGMGTTRRYYFDFLNADYSVASTEYYFSTWPASWPLDNWRPAFDVPLTYRNEIRDTVNVISKDGLRLPTVFTPYKAEAFQTQPDTPYDTGQWGLVTIDHDAEMVAITDLGPVFDVAETGLVIQTGVFGPDFFTEFDYTSDVSKAQTQIMHGYDFDADDVLVHVQFKRIIETESTYGATNTEIDRDPPPGTFWSFESNQTIEIRETLELWFDAVKVWSSVGGWRTLSGYRTETENDTNEVVTVYEEHVDSRVIIHDIDVASDSWSFTVVNELDSHDLVTTLTRSLTNTEYTRIGGIDKTTWSESSTVLEVVAAPVYWVFDIVGGTPGIINEYEAAVSRTSSLTFPTVRGFEFHSTGVGYRFLKDVDDNVLAFCPTGQEAYWDLDGDNATVAPSKWRTLRPTIFGLFDSNGVEIDISSLGFTDVEAIANCAGLKTKDAKQG